MNDEQMKSWVDAPSKTAGATLVQYARALEARMTTRLQNWEIYAAVYSEQLEVSLRPSRTRSLAQPSSTRNANLTFNAARSIVETEHATITEADPRPTIFTDDGNRPQQDKAIELQRAIDGVFSDLRGYEIYARAELDKCVLGTGVTKVHRVGNRPAIDRPLISEILVDEDLMGAGQDPKQIIHRQELSRESMLVQFKDEGAAVLQAIKDAPSVVSSGLAGHRADLIVVYDAHSLPIDADNPGKHAIAIENFDEFVFEEPWEKPRLPYTFQRWQRPTTGFYGIGIIEQLLGLQVEVNRFFRTVSKSLKRWGVVTAFIPGTGKINTQQWTNNDSGQFIPYDSSGGGGVPTFMNGPLLSPDVMAWLQFIIDVMYKVSGVPQNTAFAQREAGIPSARGQREITQKGASRLAPQSKQYERAFIDGAWLLDDIIREIKQDGEQLEISTVDQGALHKVDIDEAITLEPGTYRIDVAAGNLLSRHPASKREEIQELGNAKVFTPEEMKAMILRPDVAATIGKSIDVTGIYKRQIQLAISKGIYTEPEAFWPQLELGKKLYIDAHFENQSAGVAEDRLNILRDWIEAVRDILVPPATPETDPNAAPAPTPAQPTPQPVEAMQ